MERHAEFEDEEGVFVDGVRSDFDGGDRAGGADGCAVGFELEDIDAVADGGGFVEAGAGDTLQKVGSGGGEEGEVGVIVDDFDLRGGFEGGLGFLEFYVAVVGDKFGGDEDASVHENDAEALSEDGGIFAPRLAEVGGLAGDVDADDGRLFGDVGVGGRGGRGIRRCRGFGGRHGRRGGFGGGDILAEGLHRGRGGRQGEEKSG